MAVYITRGMVASFDSHTGRGELSLEGRRRAFQFDLSIVRSRVHPGDEVQVSLRVPPDQASEDDLSDVWLVERPSHGEYRRPLKAVCGNIGPAYVMFARCDMAPGHGGRKHMAGGMRMWFEWPNESESVSL